MEATGSLTGLAVKPTMRSPFGGTNFQIGHQLTLLFRSAVQTTVSLLFRLTSPLLHDVSNHRSQDRPQGAVSTRRWSPKQLSFFSILHDR